MSEQHFQTVREFITRNRYIGGDAKADKANAALTAIEKEMEGLRRWEFIATERGTRMDEIQARAEAAEARIAELEKLLQDNRRLALGAALDDANRRIAELEMMQKLDQQQTDDMTDEAGRLAVRVAELERTLAIAMQNTDAIAEGYSRLEAALREIAEACEKRRPDGTFYAQEIATAVVIARRALEGS